MSATPGELIRRARQSRGWTLADLGALTGYSASQVSRYERGRAHLSDVTVLRRFADVLDIPPKAFGLTAASPPVTTRHGYAVEPRPSYPRLPATKVKRAQREDGDDAVRRRKFLAITAAATAGASLPLANEAAQDTPIGQVLVARLRDAMLGIGQAPTMAEPDELPVELARAHTDFHTCRYADLAIRLPRLIRAGHTRTNPGDATEDGVLAQSYLLATRMLIKLDEQQLGWMAADRARQIAETSGHPVTVAESARNLAVLARRAGWEEQALSIALGAADDPDLGTSGKNGAAQRGLLVQSAAYSAARRGDQAGMRELTDEATTIATRLGGTTALRDHGGGFSPATVQLHRISAENSTGDPSAALAAARALPPQSLPSVERRSRYYTDVAAALAQRGRRDECVRALLAAEHQAPQETHSRPAVTSLISGLLLSGRTTTELRALAARTGALP